MNALNRATALHNIRALCPVIAVYAIGTYRKSAGLFITGGNEIVSVAGTTQGDPLAMGLYALIKCAAGDHEPKGGVQYQTVLVCR